MAEPGRFGASVRVRTTLGATAVVAAALILASVVLVLLQREALRGGAEEAAQARAEQVAGQVATGGPPSALAGEDADEMGEHDEEPQDVVVQILAGSDVVVASQPGLVLPARDGVHEVRGAEHRYVVETADASWRGTDYTVVAAVSLEDAEESVAALVPALAVGVPLMLLLVAAVTWRVVGRALAPVERMRREVDRITEERLDRRVEQPASRDEIHRLATTMNAMLARLQAARDRQRRFVSDASHELRSPIATLRQSGEVARAHPDALPAGELADTVVAESLRLQRLVEQLLLLARADEGRSADGSREVDLDDVVLAEAARARRERPSLVVDASGVGPARVLGNPLALDQVVRNLVDNALRHALSRVALSVSESGGRVRLEVADDGPGVPRADRERIFERFVRLDEARARDDGGSGLGLAIVREIVTACGGRVSVVPADGGGARFVVSLPAAS